MVLYPKQAGSVLLSCLILSSYISPRPRNTYGSEFVTANPEENFQTLWS